MSDNNNSNNNLSHGRSPHDAVEDEDMSYMLDYSTSPIRDEDFDDQDQGEVAKDDQTEDDHDKSMDSSFDSSTSHIDRAIEALNSSTDSGSGEAEINKGEDITSKNGDEDQVKEDFVPLQEFVPLQGFVPPVKEGESIEPTFPEESVLREEVNIATKLTKGYEEMQWLENRITEYKRKKDVVKADVDRLAKIATSLNNSNMCTISRYIRHNHPHQNKHVDKDLIEAEQRAHRAKEKLRVNEELNRKYKIQNRKVLLDTKHICIKKIKERKELMKLREENAQIEENIQQKLDEYMDLGSRLSQLQQDFQDEQDRQADFYKRNEELAQILAEEEDTVSRCRNNEEKWRRRADDAHHELNRILLKVADVQVELMAENAKINQTRQELITLEGECEVERMELQTVHNAFERRRKIEEKRMYQLAREEYVRYYDDIPKKHEIKEIVNEIHSEFLRFIQSDDYQEIRELVECEGVEEEKLQIIIKNSDSENLGEEQICSSLKNKEQVDSTNPGEEHFSDNEEVKKGKLENPNQYKKMEKEGLRCITCSHKFRLNEQTTNICKVEGCLAKAHPDCWGKLSRAITSRQYKEKALQECADRYEHALEFVDTKNVERTQFKCVICSREGIRKTNLVKCGACGLTTHYRCWRWAMYAVANHNEYHYCSYKHMIEELGNSLDDVLSGVHCRPTHVSESDKDLKVYYEEEVEEEEEDSISEENVVLNEDSVNTDNPVPVNDSTSSNDLVPVEKEVSEELLKLGGKTVDVLVEKVDSKSSGEEQICSSLKNKERVQPSSSSSGEEQICSSLKSKEQSKSTTPGEEQICSSHEEEEKKKAQETKDRVAKLEQLVLATNYKEKSEDYVRVKIDIDALVLRHDNLRDMTKECIVIHKKALNKLMEEMKQKNKDAFKSKVEIGCQICLTPISPWSKRIDIRECRCCARQVHKACWETCGVNVKEEYDVEVDNILGTFCSFACRHMFLRLESKTEEVDVRDLDKKILGDILLIIQQNPEPKLGRYTKYLQYPKYLRCVLCLKEANGDAVSECVECSRRVHCSCYLDYITIDTKVDQPLGRDDHRAIYCSVICRARHNVEKDKGLSYKDLDTVFHDHNQRFLEVSMEIGQEIENERFMWQIKWAYAIILEHENLTNEYMAMIREHAEMVKAQEAEEKEWEVKEDDAFAAKLALQEARNKKSKSKKKKVKNPGEEQICSSLKSKKRKCSSRRESSSNKGKDPAKKTTNNTTKMKKTNKKKQSGCKSKNVKKKMVSPNVEAKAKEVEEEIAEQPAKKKRKVEPPTNIVIKIGIKKTPQGDVYQVEPALLQQKKTKSSPSKAKKSKEDVRQKKSDKSRVAEKTGKTVIKIGVKNTPQGTIYQVETTPSQQQKKTKPVEKKDENQAVDKPVEEDNAGEEKKSQDGKKVKKNDGKKKKKDEKQAKKLAKENPVVVKKTAKQPVKRRKKMCAELTDYNITASMQEQIAWIQKEKIVGMPNTVVLRKKALLYRGIPFHKPDGGYDNWTPRQKYEYAQLCLTVPDIGAREKGYLCCWRCDEFHGQLTKALRKHYATYVREFGCFEPIISVKRTPEEAAQFDVSRDRRDECAAHFTLDALAEAMRLALGTTDNEKDEIVVNE